jgi:tetratricopeptide (TPR) repeat protein
LKRLGDLDRAIVHYQKAVETFVNPVEKGLTYHWLGKAQLQKGLWDEGIASFKRCIELNARTSLPYHWAQLLANYPPRRDPAAAVRLAQALIEGTPKDQQFRQGLGWQALAWGRYRLGDFKGAIVAINKVKELGSPGDSFEWFLLALAHKQLGNAKEAREWYDKAVEWMNKNAPQDGDLRLLRGEASQLFGEPAVRELAPPPRAKP